MVGGTVRCGVGREVILYPLRQTAPVRASGVWPSRWRKLGSGARSGLYVNDGSLFGYHSYDKLSN